MLNVSPPRLLSNNYQIKPTNTNNTSSRKPKQDLQIWQWRLPISLFQFFQHRLVALSPIVRRIFNFPPWLPGVRSRSLAFGVTQVRQTSSRHNRRVAFVKAIQAVREVGSPCGGVQGSISLIGVHAGGETCSRTGSLCWKFHPGEHNISQTLHFHVKTFGARWKEVHFSYFSFWSTTFFFSSQLVFRP